MKKGNKGLFSSEYKSRYFVLIGTKLFYFSSWEEYGAMGLNGATNSSRPIMMSEYLATPVRSEPLKLDLVPIENPLARTWELMATTVQVHAATHGTCTTVQRAHRQHRSRHTTQEANEWCSALRAASLPNSSCTWLVVSA